MPTIDDLRDLLDTRAREAGDPQSLRTQVLQRARAGRPRRAPRRAPVLAAVAATAAVAVGAAVLTTNHTPGERHDPPPAASSAIATGRSVTPPTPAAGGLSWLFAVRPVTGYQFGGRTQLGYGQVVQFARDGVELFGATGGPRGIIELYARGRTPDTGSPAKVLTHGAPVRVAGTVGRYYLGQLVWRWAPDSWAVLNVLQTGLPNGRDGQTQAKYLTLTGAVRRLADAVRPTPGDPVTVPMTVRGLPALGLHPRGATVTANPAEQACVAFDRAQPADVPLGPQEQPTDDQALRVCRGTSPLTDGWLDAGQPTTVAGHPARRYRNGLSVTLADGSRLSIQLGIYGGPHGDTVLTRARAITPADQARIAGATDTSPDPHVPASWVPVGR